MYLNHDSNRSSIASDESGMMIVQVVIMSAILLAVLLAGFKTVQTSLQVSNTTATSAAFKDLVLAVQQNLASTKTCTARLGFPVNLNLASITLPNGFEVKVRPPSGPPGVSLIPIAEKETNSSSRPVSSDFKITEVKLRNVRQVGWVGGLPALANGAAGTQELSKVMVDLNIVAERRSGFLGGKAMSAQVPLLLGVVGVGGARQIKNCTTRSLYQVELGPTPPGSVPSGWVRKTGLECIDRGGVPMIAPNSNPPWHLCRLSQSTLLTCGIGNPPTNNLPGWKCYQSTREDQNGELYTYVY